ncbi:MAG TPA: hypothetical protein VII63_05930 [Caulobacteraceae bacterium]
MAGKTTLLALFAGSALWLAIAAAPSSALAGGSGGGGCGCIPPPPVPPPCNCSPPPGHTINIPGVNVFVAPSVVVNTNVNATAVATTQAASQSFFNGGGGGGGISPPVATGIVQGLDVGGEHRRTAYEAMRTLYKKVVIQAFCFDDKMTPHPASQVSAERDIDDLYEGELYRCIAGTHMQVTIADWKQNISFAGGETLTCNKGEALYHVAGARGGRQGARLQCRPQKPARDCNERSLLRRFGAGIKILTVMVTERYTAYREETTTSTATSMSLDGGVGGVAY